VRQVSPDAKTLLDIGCGIGTFVLKSRELGLSAEGVEPSPYAVQYAREHSSLSLKQAYFGANLFDVKFDVVVADNVLEHVPAPRAFLRDVFAVLNGGGILYLAVPGRRGGLLRVVYSLLCPTSRLSLFADNDVHINHFSRKSILKLIEPFHATVRLQLHSGAYIIQAKA
jgi:2-polyprenyl-3-methyl-5-hydroxy-6-metoxy-1,4-benzoquinol methylase